MRSTRSTLAILGAVCTLLLTACTAAMPVSAPTPSPNGALPGFADNVDEISPLVLTTLTPDPIPFAGTDGKVHLAYEIQVLNAGPRPATLTKLQTLSNGPKGKVIAEIDAPELAVQTTLVGDLSVGNVIPPGRTALVVLDTRFDAKKDVPAALIHRISATFATSPSDDRLAKLYPTEATQFGGSVITSTDSVLTIGPPLTGNNWVTIGSCCELAGHRGFILPMGGRLNATERFGLDMIQIDTHRERLVDEATGALASFTGDPKVATNYFAFGEPVLSVADGTVIGVKNTFVDHPVEGFSEGLQMADLTGNYVIIDVGNGISAMVNHLVQGSVTVKVGDKVARGQRIGKVGNSGNSTQPHLHFQMFRGSAPLMGENVPFQFNNFTLVGGMHDGLYVTDGAGPQSKKYPLVNSITDYPKH